VLEPHNLCGCGFDASTTHTKLCYGYLRANKYHKYQSGYVPQLVTVSMQIPHSPG